MDKPNKLTKAAKQEILDSIPSTADVWRELQINSEMVALADKQYLNTAATCLHDLAEYLQFIGMGVYKAKCAWHRYKDLKIEDYPQRGKHLYAVHFARYHADTAINSLVAAMTHLTNATWHFFTMEKCAPNRYDHHMDIIKVLASDAKSSSIAAELRAILSDSRWKYIHGYRNKWHHCELPRISGEMRRKKELIWQQEGDPKPDWYLMRASDSKGRVAYFGAVQFVHSYDMPKLIDHCAGLLKRIIEASRSFLVVFREELKLVAASRGLTLTFEDIVKK